MIGLLSGLHPTFDSLSAHADRTDVDGARTRIGRHVARCASCREVVAEIRALGDAARAMPTSDMPAGLWARIQVAAVTPPRSPVAQPPQQDGHTTTTPQRGAMRRRRVAGVTISALAAGVIAALAWPRSSGLEAAGTSRFTFSPTRPVPGGAVTLRYVPAPWMKDAPRLVLVGRFARAAGSNPQRFGGSVFDELGDSVAVLTRAPDGAFVGTLTLPTDFLAVHLAVLDPVKDEHDKDVVAPWLIIGGTPAHGPSFASFLAALEVRPRFNDGRDAHPRQAVEAADSLQRHFPRHPAGWAFSHSYGMARGRFDFLRFFQTAERKYSSLFDELWPARGLDAERLHDMVAFGYNISEPGEVLRWAARLVDEHPEDPRALDDLAGALHEMELRGPPALGDSIRGWLPGLDRAYRSAPVPNEGFDEALRLVDSYGDSAAKVLWHGREGANGGARNIWLLARWSKRASRDSVVHQMRERAERSCTLPAGRWPLMQTVGEWRRLCELQRGIAYGFVSTRSLDDGHARLALADADSTIVMMRRGGFCTPWWAYRTRALAALALGDTVAAQRAFATGAAGFPAGATIMMDSARAHLGARFDQAPYLARSDSARLEARDCVAESRARITRERRVGG